MDGQFEFLEASLLTSFELEEARQAPQMDSRRPRLLDEDFKFVRDLGLSVRQLAEAKSHIANQLRGLSQAVEKGTTPSYLKSSARPPHPHRGFQYRSLFLKTLEAANTKVSQLFLRLTKEEYVFQVADIQQRIETTQRAARIKLGDKFTNPREHLTATGLFSSFSTVRSKGVKRKRYT